MSRRCSVERACATCGKAFRRPPSREGRFCSPACAYASFHKNGWAKAKPKVAIRCETCGVARTIKPHQVGRSRFCSQRCMIVARTKAVPPAVRIERRCDNCARPFKSSPTRQREGRGRFCSKACVGLYVVRCGTRVSGPERRCLDALEAEGVVVQRSYSACGYVMDGYVPAWNLMVEVDGIYWHSLPAMKARDAEKDAALAAAGYAVARIRVDRTEPNWRNLAIALVDHHGRMKERSDA